MMPPDSTQHLLAVLPFLPGSPQKSAHLLLFRELVKRNWRVTVLTVGRGEQAEEEFDGVALRRVHSNNWRWKLGRVNGFGKWFARPLMIPDRFIGARSALIDAAREVCSQQPANVVMSLYHPATSHLVARDLAREFEIPWIAATKDFFSWPNEKISAVRRWKNSTKRRWEQRTLNDASRILAVNDNLTGYLRELVPEVIVETLPHCFDAEAYPSPSPQGSQGPFRFVSVGLTDESDVADFEKFFKAIGESLDRGELNANNFRLRFVGHGGERIERAAAGTSATSVIEISKPVPHKRAMQELVDADCLLFHQAAWGNRRRLAEYFGARRPILAFPTSPELMSDRMLRAYQAAVLIDDWKALGERMAEMLQQIRNGAFPAPNETIIEQSSASSVALVLENHLNETIQSHNSVETAA